MVGLYAKPNDFLERDDQTAISLFFSDQKNTQKI